MSGSAAPGRSRLDAAPWMLFVPLAVACAVLLLRWPGWPLVTDAALDADWMLALNVAQQDGLRWGSQVVFTYGPLGYTIAPQLPGALRILVASSVFALGIGCTFGWVYQLARPALGVGPGALLAGAATWLAFGFPFFGEGGLLVPVLVGSLTSVRGASLRRLALIGCLVGLLGHQAISAAAVGAGVASVVALAVRGPRGLAAVVGSAAAVWLGVWMLTGQALADLPAFLSGTWQVVTGYSLAMTLEMTEARWTYVAALVVGLASIALTIAVARELGPRPRAGLIVAVGIAGWWAVKEGFTRHDIGHATVAFSVAAVVALCLALVATRKPGRALGLAVVVASTISIALAGWPVVAPDLLAGPAAFVHTARAVADPAAGDREAVAAYAALVRPEDADLLRAEVAGRETIADPLGIGAVLALGGTPAPLPAVELYSSYTPGLDALNAASLAQRPRQVLRAVPYWSVDDRNPYWESPAYQRALYCGYDTAVRASSWLLLRPAPDDRCGDPEQGPTVEAVAGQQVTVPRREGAITEVTITPHPSLLWQASRLLLKVRPLHVDYGGRRYRLAESPSAEGLMLNVPVAHPAFADVPAEPSSTIAVDVDSTVSFSFVPVRTR